MISRREFGRLDGGRVVETFRLEGERGIAVEILTLGGIIRSVHVPDRDGNVADVALGYDDLDSYLVNAPYFGCIVGRCANRIAGAEFEIDGDRFHLPRNDGENCLHGGKKGFGRALWSVREAGAGSLHLTHASPDGDEGFPGALSAEAIYTLAGDTLSIDFRATTDKPTIVNLSTHAYWNLAGPGAGSIFDPRLEIDADAFTPVDAHLVPTGEIRTVSGTPFDLRDATVLRERVSASEPQIEAAHGIDHNFVLRGPSDGCRRAACLADPASGRVLEVFTTEPGLQVYTGNGLGGTRGKGGVRYADWGGIALEPQHFPDAPHHPHFPAIVLRPNQTFSSTTRFRVSVNDA